MISKQEKFMWLVWGAILFLLFALSSTNLIIKEEKKEVYPISVIADDENDELYINFRKGIDQAAINYNADISFITLYHEGSSAEQLEMIKREQTDGALAVVVVPVDDAVIVTAADENRINGPIIMMNSSLGSPQIAGNITTDYDQMGQLLAAQVMKHHDEKNKIWIFLGNRTSMQETQVFEVLKQCFQEAGYQYEAMEASDELTCRDFVEQLVYPENSQAVIVTADAGSLAETTGVLKNSPVYQRHVLGLYGVGSTLGIVNAMDEGVIDGIVTVNEYLKGYLSIRDAVEAIKNSGSRTEENLNCYYLEQGDIRNSQYENMLFPIE